MMVDDGHLLSAMTMLKRLKDKQEWFNMLNKILIDKAESYLREHFEQGMKNTNLIYEEEYKRFLAFQSLIYKGAMENLKLKSYLGQPEVELTRIKTICSKIIEY